MRTRGSGPHGPTTTGQTEQSQRPDLSALHRLTALFADSIEEIDPAAGVTWCPGWRVRSLVNHLARVHHWAAAQARRGPQTPLGRAFLANQADYRRCADELLQTLSDLDPDAPAWTLTDDGVPPAQHAGTVRFWDRRQKLETLVHLWDLRTAGGLTLDPQDLGGPDADRVLWTDCVREVAEVMQPRQVRLGRVDPPEVTLALRTPDGELARVSSPGSDTVTITASPRELALLCWGRASVAEASFAVDGDRAALARCLARLTP